MSNKRKEEGNWRGVFGLFTSIVSILVFLALFFSMGNRIVVKNNEVKVYGISPMTIKKEEIKSVELIDTIPKVIKKIKGVTGGKSGLYKLENGEKAYIYVNSLKGPFIKILTEDKIIYLALDQEKTKNIYCEILNLLERKGKV